MAVSTSQSHTENEEDASQCLAYSESQKVQCPSCYGLNCIPQIYVEVLTLRCDCIQRQGFQEVIKVKGSHEGLVLFYGTGGFMIKKRKRERKKEGGSLQVIKRALTRI